MRAFRKPCKVCHSTVYDEFGSLHNHRTGKVTCPECAENPPYTIPAPILTEEPCEYIGSAEERAAGPCPQCGGEWEEHLPLPDAQPLSPLEQRQERAKTLFAEGLSAEEVLLAFAGTAPGQTHSIMVNGASQPFEVKGFTVDNAKRVLCLTFKHRRLASQWMLSVDWFTPVPYRLDTAIGTWCRKEKPEIAEASWRPLTLTDAVSRMKNLDTLALCSKTTLAQPAAVGLKMVTECLKLVEPLLHRRPFSWRELGDEDLAGLAKQLSGQNGETEHGGGI